MNASQGHGRNASPGTAQRRRARPRGPRVAAAALGSLLATLALPSCALPPRCAVTGTSGTVRADTPELARQADADLEAAVPRIRALVPATRVLRPEVWVQAQPWAFAWQQQPEYVRAFSMTSMGRIHVPPETDAVQRASTMAHECVHVLLDDSWEPLPAALEEGLCERVACDVVPASAAGTRGRWHAAVAAALGGIDVELEWPIPEVGGMFGVSGRMTMAGVDIREALSVDPAIHTSALATAEIATRALGFLVVERIVAAHGYAGLHDLVVEAARDGHEVVPVDALLEAADLGEDPARWRELALTGLDEQALQQAVIMLALDLAPKVLVQAQSQARSRALGPGLSARELLAAADPWIALTDRAPGVADVRVRLLLVPEFVGVCEQLLEE